MIHSPEARLPGTGPVPEGARLDVFLPIVLHEQGHLRATFAHLVQYFSEHVARERRVRMVSSAIPLLQMKVRTTKTPPFSSRYLQPPTTSSTVAAQALSKISPLRKVLPILLCSTFLAPRPPPLLLSLLQSRLLLRLQSRLLSHPPSFLLPRPCPAPPRWKTAVPNPRGPASRT